MKRSMKRNARRVLSLMLALIMCICCFPFEAFAWKNLTHVTSANLILLELERSIQQTGKATVTVKVPYSTGTSYTYEIPQEYREAIIAYPSAFRAGSMGPDFYPDILTGQSNIHPYLEKDGKVGKSGDWIPLLVNSVNMLPQGSEERKEALAFTLGFMLHYCGDMFGHDFINAFAGGTYPALSDVKYWDSTDERLNIILSHMAEESYMDSKVSWNWFHYYGMLNIAAPIDFVTNTLVYDGNANNGLADTYSNYKDIPILYQYLVVLRSQLYQIAEQMRPHWYESWPTAFFDNWVEDLDRATEALVRAFNNMANTMVDGNQSQDVISIVEAELETWFDTYGKYISPLPDAVADFTSALKYVNKVFSDIPFIADINAWKKEQIAKIATAIMGFAGIQQAIDNFKARIKDPKEQLNHADNPFLNGEDNFAEFDAYMARFAEEMKLGGKGRDSILNGTDGGALDAALDSGLEAFYNTLTMYKLILMGPDNFTDFIYKLSGVNQTQYTKNTAELIATGLDVRIITASRTNAGTDDNVYLIVRDGNRLVKEKLLDESGHDDFEKGRDDLYTVELGDGVKLQNLNVSVIKRSYGAGTASPDWDCDCIMVAATHAGAKITDYIICGGKYDIKNDDEWNLNFQARLQERQNYQNTANAFKKATSVDVTITTSTGGSGGTDRNMYLTVFGGAETVDYLLDKSGYDDFEQGDSDTYHVDLPSGGIPLDKIDLAIKHGGSTDPWTGENVYVTLYDNNVQITAPIVIRGDMTLKNSSWYLNLQINDTLKKNLTKPIVFSYETNLDDGMVSYMYSLDDSHQWVNSSSILWSNTTVRKNVFFKIFKGFSPDISYSGGTKEIKVNQAFSLSFDLEGVWNGVRASRRDKEFDKDFTHPNNADAMTKTPAVNGTATIEFLNKSGTCVCSTTGNVSSGALALTNYSNANLTDEYYDVRVTYTADPGDPKFADSVEVFENVLKVIPPTTYDVTFHVVNGSWDDGTILDKTEKVSGYEGDPFVLTANQIPAVGNEPADTYKAGSWDPVPDTTTQITENKEYTYTYAKKDWLTHKVTFKVVNGEWDEGGNADKEVVLEGWEDVVLKLGADDIPAVGSAPNETYKAGTWDIVPSTENAIIGDTVFVYTYANKETITQTVKFRVVHGSWDDGSTAEKTVTLSGLEGDILTLAPNHIPAVGQKADYPYKPGSWDVEPDTQTEITQETVYTYTFVMKDEIHRDVTFVVVNGAWNDGDTADKHVRLDGYEEDILRLAADDIPAVGSNPADYTYKAGSWDVTPDTITEITQETTYTYTYAKKDEITYSVTFRVENGLWNDGTGGNMTVKFDGYEGDTFMLDPAQIPDAGRKPAQGYEAGGWDIVPGTEIIDGNKTYTYSYAKKPESPDTPPIYIPPVTTTPPNTTAPDKTSAPDNTTDPGQEDEPDTTVAPDDPSDPDTTTVPGDDDYDDDDDTTTVPDDDDDDYDDATIVPDDDDDDPDTTTGEPGEPIVITDPVIPPEILEEIQGEDVDLIIDIGNGMEWIINGLTVTGAPEAINMAITDDTGIPVDVINRVTGERYSIQIHLEHEGPFPFDAVLKINLKSSNVGYIANLFYYNPDTGKLEYVSASKIDENGDAYLNFHHASDYTIIIDREAMDGNPHTGTALAGIPVLAVLAGAAAVFGLKRRKKDDEDK